MYYFLSKANNAWWKGMHRKLQGKDKYTLHCGVLSKNKYTLYKGMEREYVTSKTNLGFEGWGGEERSVM